MSKAATGARYLIVVAAALATRQVVGAYQQRHRRLDGASAHHWAEAVRPPAPVSPQGTAPPQGTTPAQGTAPPQGTAGTD